jgi:hypothetical protein
MEYAITWPKFRFGVFLNFMGFLADIVVSLLDLKDDGLCAAAIGEKHFPSCCQRFTTFVSMRIGYRYRRYLRQ